MDFYLTQLILTFTLFTGNPQIPYQLDNLLTPKLILQNTHQNLDENSLIHILLNKTAKNENSKKQVIAKAIIELGAQKFKVRQAAQKTLLKAGISAVEQLKKATHSPDPNKTNGNKTASYYSAY